MPNNSSSIEYICQYYLDHKDGFLWKDLLITHLKGKPHPLLVHTDNVVSAAALWTYVKIWKDEFRARGAFAGKTIWICLEPSPEWVIVFLAALWENLTIIICDYEGTIISENSSSWAMVSRNFKNSNWAFSKNLEPIIIKQCNANDHSLPNDRIRFAKEIQGENIFTFGLTDAFLAESILQLRKNFKDGETVFSSLSWSTPLGFFYDFFSSFFLSREIFISGHLRSARPISLEYFKGFNIDYVNTDLNSFNDLNQKLKADQTIPNFKGGYLLNQDETLPPQTMGISDKFKILSNSQSILSFES